MDIVQWYSPIPVEGVTYMMIGALCAILGSWLTNMLRRWYRRRNTYQIKGLSMPVETTLIFRPLGRIEGFFVLPSGTIDATFHDGKRVIYTPKEVKE